MAKLASIVAVTVVIGVGLAVAIDRYNGTVFDEPPEAYVTRRFETTEFRHPPGWTARRLREAVGPGLVMRERRPGEGGLREVLELRHWGGDVDAGEQARRAAVRLVAGKVIGGETAYEIGVPGSDESDATDLVFETRDGTRYRVTTVFARRAGVLTTLTVRGRVTDRRDDPRNIAGSLRFVD